MAKVKTVFICSNCGVQSAKWIGRCPSCNEWNTYQEEVISKTSVTKPYQSPKNSGPFIISEIPVESEERLVTMDKELNRVLGGGIVKGSVILLGGEPGIGKSTLALQLALNMNNVKTLYVSGEESIQQIKLRAERLTEKSDDCYVYCDNSLENVLNQCEQVNPGIIFIDSIQTLYSDQFDATQGSIVQVRECAARLSRYAKENNIPVILIGHINKEGSLAGPKVLEHAVDVVLQFEGEQNYVFRVLRSLKNRYGATPEIGIYEMLQSGLQIVDNPSEILLSKNEDNLSGVTVACMINGIRPFLIEMQALVSSAVYGTPQRSCTGFDVRRLNMLLAVLEKRAGFHLVSKDVFLNVAGGIKSADPAVDLAIICAVLSSSVDRPIDKTTCFAAEVGLTGELRPVNRIEHRIAEAERLGFKKIFISKYNINKKDFSKFRLSIEAHNRVEDVFKLLFKK
ncbi:MAG: DNA repair protein RadA [Bacteroidales bacterium]|nr:DNA repair protein RadA [Bacteroidales bacterium]